jgi:hypothetical protein
VLNVIGIVAMILGLLALVVTIRDIALAMYFGGPQGRLIGAYNTSATIVDGVIALVFLGIGWLMLRPHFERKAPRLIMGAAVVLAVLLGLNAARVMVG